MSTNDKNFKMSDAWNRLEKTQEELDQLFQKKHELVRARKKESDPEIQAVKSEIAHLKARDWNISKSFKRQPRYLFLPPKRTGPTLFCTLKHYVAFSVPRLRLISTVFMPQWRLGCVQLVARSFARTMLLKPQNTPRGLMTDAIIRFWLVLLMKRFVMPRHSLLD